MAEAQIRKFDIVGKTSDCNQQAADPKQDKCRVTVFEGLPDKGESFTLERKGKDYAIASADLSRVTKLFPTFKPPAQNLNDFLIARAEFFKVLGDINEPSDFGKSVTIPAEGLQNNVNLLAAFVGMGEPNPSNPVKKFQLIDALDAGVGIYGDPKMGPKLTEILAQIDKNPNLSTAAGERVAYLIAVQEAWNKLWTHIQPVLDKGSNGLDNSMKASAAILTRFLFANHLLDEKGTKAILDDKVYETGKLFFDEMSRLDVDGKFFGDYYEFMLKGIQQIKTPKLSPTQKAEFNKRLALLERTFTEAGKNRIAYLANQSTQKSAKESLRMKYGDTAVRQKLLESILKNLEVKDIGGRPNFEVAVSAIHQEWKGILASPFTPEAKNEHIEAMNYLMKQLFERNGKMKMFWRNDFEVMDNFYDPIQRSILSDSSKHLGQLVNWVRAQALEAGTELPGEAKPHVPLRQPWLYTELAVGGVGTAGAFAFHFGAKDKDPELQYYGTWGSIILGASGLGAAGGNALSYGLDVNPKYSWLFDVGGGILGGLAGGLIYGFTTTPPGGSQPGQPDPGTRFPVDPYGP